MDKVISLFSMRAVGSKSTSADFSTADDRALLGQLKRGNHGALSEILHRYESPLIGYLISILADRDTAEDIAQDTFLKLIKRPPLILSSGKLKPWLFRVAHNLARDFQRKHGRTHIVEAVPDEADPTPTAPGSQHDTEVLLSQLSPEIREVVSLRIYADLSFKEISKQLGIPIGTATWRMKHGLESLRNHINTAA